MSLLLLTDSILTTVQDLGRNNFRLFGVNPNGVMDRKAARLINILLGNSEDEAVLEIHFPAPKILFEKTAVIALGGADFSACLDEIPLQNWRPFLVKKGQILAFKCKNLGNRLYLSVKGGFQIESWLGSKSTNLKAQIGGYKGRRLLKNDRILLKQKSKSRKIDYGYFITPALIPQYSISPRVRCLKGAEWEILTEESKTNFLKNKFDITLNSDRMGFRLKGKSLQLSKNIELVSSAVSFGTIQLLPDGQMIILMADHQTTGGYPRIAHICAEDLPLAAQLGAKDSLSFETISIDEAEMLILNFERNLNLLKTAVKFK